MKSRIPVQFIFESECGGCGKELFPLAWNFLENAFRDCMHSGPPSIEYNVKLTTPKIQYLFNTCVFLGSILKWTLWTDMTLNLDKEFREHTRKQNEYYLKYSVSILHESIITTIAESKSILAAVRRQWPNCERLIFAEKVVRGTSCTNRLWSIPDDPTTQHKVI